VWKISCAGELGKFLGNLVHTTNGINDPNLVSDTNVAIFTNVAHKGTVGGACGGIVELRIIRILKVARKIGLYVMSMNVLPCLNIAGSVSDGIAILYDILAALDVTESILVTILKIDVNVIKLIY
jgi:hypothetical protein